MYIVCSIDSISEFINSLDQAQHLKMFCCVVWLMFSIT